MPVLMGLTTANAALQILTTVTKTLNATRERAQNSKDTDLKTLINQLYDDVATLKEAVSRLTEENSELRRKQLAPSTPTPKQKEFRLPHSKPVNRSIYLDSDDCWRMGEGRDYGTQVNCGALLLPVYFDPRHSTPGAYIDNATASLVFTDTASGQEYRVGHACWIDGTKLYFLDIRQGDTIYILLTISPGDDVFSTVSNNKTDYNWYKERNPKAAFDIEDLPLGVYKLEVVIEWSSNQKVMVDLPFDLNELKTNTV
jgi:hypothetical protein